MKKFDQNVSMALRAKAVKFVFAILKRLAAVGAVLAAPSLHFRASLLGIQHCLGKTIAWVKPSETQQIKPRSGIL
ncbi:hypothetical protein [Desulfatibacillum aliphaticivorans]|uniref:hypothetical protein n=1 Tax=Desulfatibacillum aliphaticivorans TaxID=218208 RepID=UPI000486633E|nr:hypothetical protein [Desulfatibacillum aliphaticivorans]